jgi:hypothetical protein
MLDVQLCKESAVSKDLVINSSNPGTTDKSGRLTFDFYGEAGWEGGSDRVDGCAKEAAVGARAHPDPPVAAVHYPVPHPVHLCIGQQERV